MSTIILQKSIIYSAKILLYRAKSISYRAFNSHPKHYRIGKQSSETFPSPHKILFLVQSFPTFTLSTHALVLQQVIDYLLLYLQGPLINSKQLDRVVSMVNEAVDKGAQLVTGGKKHPIGDLYFRPTILTELTPEMAAFKEEIFGPVISVLKFKTEDEALALANATRVGLAGYFYSNDVRQCWRVAKKIEVRLYLYGLDQGEQILGIL